MIIYLEGINPFERHNASNRAENRAKDVRSKHQHDLQLPREIFPVFSTKGGLISIYSVQT